MEQAAPQVRQLARLLLALEMSRSGHEAEEARAALSVFDRLRAHLSRLVGVVGFQALLARALALAKNEADWLTPVYVQADAGLEGFSEAACLQSAQAVAEGSAALLAHLLGLLATFIGDALTLRLVADMWPEARLNDDALDSEEDRHE